MDESGVDAGKVTALRRAFDDAFAAPARGAAAELEDLLAVRVAGDGYVIRLREIGGIVRAGKIAPLPCRDAVARGVLGLAGLRGSVVPVFSLAVLLGYGTREAPRWLVSCAGPDGLVALAVAELEGYLKVPRVDLRVAEGAPAARPHLNEIATTGAGALPVIGVVSLVQASLGGRAGTR